MSYDQVAGASGGDDAFLGGASQGGRGIRKVVKWTFELRTEFATSFKFRKAKWVCELLAALAKFSQANFGVVKFSQGACGVVKFLQAYELLCFSSVLEFPCI